MSVVSARVLKPLCLALESQGLSVSKIIEQAGIDSALLTTDSAVLSEAQLQMAWHLADQQSQGPVLGIETGLNTEPSSFGILGYVLKNAANIRQAYSLLTRYRELVFDEQLFQLREQGGEAIIQLRRSPQTDPEISRPLAEFLVAVLLSLGGALLSGSQQNHGLASRYLKRVEFRHSRPDAATLAAYQQQLNTDRFVFGCHDTALVFSAELLDLPTVLADPELLALLTAKADAELKSLATESEIVKRVRAIVRRRMLGSTPSIVKTAEDCAMSRASLQRQLAAAGTSFQTVLEQEREQLAKQMLGEPSNSIGHIAFMLGYGDSAAFNRAFKRWQRCSPSDYRRQQA